MKIALVYGMKMFQGKSIRSRGTDERA